ncbi:hypothetical protein, partial [Pseudomonas sp. AH2 (2023)]|uniref:hypothetical protein n=1 Tax=Pseudomonas sp. AH2 (2023) TaxID=3048599 RepID=UPI002B2323A1
RQHTVRHLEHTASGVVLDDTLRAAVLIGADGAESRIRRSISPDGPAAGTVALAIRGYAAELPGQQGAQQITMSGRNWPA